MNEELFFKVFNACLLIAVIYYHYRKFKKKKLERLEFENLKKDTGISVNDKLNKVIEFKSSKGYTVIHRSESQVQLKKEKVFNWEIAFICLLLFVVPFFVYLLHYITKRPEIEVFTFK